MTASIEKTSFWKCSHSAFTSLAAVVRVDSEVRRWVRLTAPLDAILTHSFGAYKLYLWMVDIIDQAF